MKKSDIKAQLDFLKSTAALPIETISNLHRHARKFGLDLLRFDALDIDTMGLKETAQGVYVLYTPATAQVWGIGHADEVDYLFQRVEEYTNGLLRPVGILNYSYTKPRVEN